jgi:hypothetical protein
MDWWGSYSLSRHSSQHILRMSSAWTNALTDSWSRTVTHFKGPRGGYDWLTGTKKKRWWNVSSFSITAEHTRGFKCPHRQKSRGLSSTCCWAVPRNMFADIHVYWYKLFSLFWCGGTQFWILSKYFRYILYKRKCHRHVKTKRFDQTKREGKDTAQETSQWQP